MKMETRRLFYEFLLQKGQGEQAQYFKEKFLIEIRSSSPEDKKKGPQNDLFP